jgi:uncharacterized membrane protein YdjX (TVP38/TMEM64 family)
VDWFFEVEQIAEWLNDFGTWAIIISILLNIVISMLGVVPSLFLSGANAVVFGMVPGFFISLIGEALGAGVSFWLYRFGIRKAKMNHKSWGWLQSMNEVSRKRQLSLLMLARLTPLMPSGIITFAAALSSMKFLDFLMVTTLGKVPSIAMETLIGHDLLLIDENLPRLIISVALFVMMYILVKRRNKQ